MKLLPMYTDRIEKNRTEISFTVPHWDNSGVPAEKWQTDGAGSNVQTPSYSVS